MTIFLRQGREKKFRNFHVLAYREEIGRMDGRERAGGIVDIRAHDGSWIGRGTYTRFAHIPLRLLTREDEPIDRGFFERRLSALVARKRAIVEPYDTNSYRLVHGEADGLPGLVVDVFGDVVVVQVRTLGMERLREHWQPVLMEVTGAKGMQERSDMKRRKEERLDPVNKTLFGEVPDFIDVHEGPLVFSADVRQGLKTGFYLDQRENRALLRQIVKPGMRVLDLFTYSGGFALNAAQAGAEVLGIDLKEDAIDLARANASRNDISNVNFEVANCFEWLDEEAREGERWDVVIVDPPAIAHNKENWERLRWAMWRLVRRSLERQEIGDRLFAFTCSHHLNRERFLETLRFAGADSGHHLHVVREVTQPTDHPWSLQIPESQYLRGFLVETVNCVDVPPFVAPPRRSEPLGGDEKDFDLDELPTD